jgi:tetratricopeptide (TPR) repeat protein
MTKVGRNHPCPCGSGKKYKHCCLEKDRAAEHALAATTPAKTSRSIPETPLGLYFDDDEDELTPASNAVLDLVEAGKLDEAEQAARDLLQRFPEVHDGYDRLALIYEARGDHKQAADYYRRAMDVLREDPGHNPEMVDLFRNRADKLDPPAAA